MSKELDPVKYAKLFVSESRDLLRIANESLIQYEKDTKDRELVDQVFRSCHTIKGMAAMMNLAAVSEAAHAVEDVLAMLRDGRAVPTAAMIEGIFKGLDELDGMVSTFEKSGTVPEDKDFIARMAALVGTAQEPQEPKPEKKPKKERIEGKDDLTFISVRLGRRCSLPSARAMVIINELKKTCEVVRTTPSEKDIEREKFFEELTVALEPGEKFEEAVRRISSMTDVEELLVGTGDIPRDKWQRLAKKESVAATMVQESTKAQTVRVTMDKLDDLLDDVGELVIGRSRLIQKSQFREDHDLQDISALIDKLTSNIQEKVLGIRMIPLELVMGRFPRMVRDLAKEQNKEAELVVEGSGIELDRTVVDKIVDPMMHLLRNCVDHGIETVEERQRAGKKTVGLIRVVASKQQDHVLIEISDDGRGIDLETLRKTAVSKGVLTDPQAQAASGKDLMDLMFKPGFSTKAEVTGVSGRGVGLDVVKRNVEMLGGSVMVSTTKGAGTTFSLWMPFTLAIIEAMLIEIASQTYAVAMGSIVESHRYEDWEIKLIRNREVVQLRGEVLPLIRMRDFFGVPRGPDKRNINSLIVQSRDRRAAIEVDVLIGHQQIVVKGLDQRLRGVKGISGGTVLGSGSIALILDVESIIGA
ncbi:MAG TPA: chemotaxis protein CheA [Thermoplasmata archaeon]|nr:chemotaxis protein CheA [Thermoplasmata archaeon]